MTTPNMYTLPVKVVQWKKLSMLHTSKVFVIGLFLFVSLRFQNHVVQIEDEASLSFRMVDEIASQAPPLCLISSDIEHKSSTSDPEKILQLANAIWYATEKVPSLKGRVSVIDVALDEDWSNWYKKYFEPREDIQMRYDYEHNPCSKRITGSDVMKLRQPNQVFPELFHLIPKKDIQNQAKHIIENDFPSYLLQRGNKKRINDPKIVYPVITVHHTNLNGQCHEMAKKSLSNNKDNLFCFKDNKSNRNNNNNKYNNYRSTCEYKESDVAKPHSNMTIITLHSDRINTSTDDNEEHQYGNANLLDFDHVHSNDGPNDTLLIQMWAMSISDEHYANPMSSIDFIINHWRDGRHTHPVECFEFPDMW